MRLPRRWWLLYLLLLANSLAWESRHEPLARWYDDSLPHEPSLNSPLMDDRGPVAEPVLNSLAYRVWPVQAGRSGRMRLPSLFR